MNLKIVTVALLVLVLLRLTEFIPGSPFNPASAEEITPIYISFMFINLVISIIVAYGFIKIAKINKSRFLEVMSYVSITYSIVLFIHLIVFSLLEKGLILLFVNWLLGSVIGIIFAIAFLQTRKKYGKLVLWISIPSILVGMLSTSPSVAGSVPIIIADIIIIILMAVFFFKVAKNN